MKPPYRDDSRLFTGKPEGGASSPEMGGVSAGQRSHPELKYVERADPATWEDRQRPRSYPESMRILTGALSIMATWLSMVGVIVSVLMRYTGHPDPWALLSVVFLVLLGITLVVSLILSLNSRCPLCHGPPLHSRRCPKHRLAERWIPLTHRATVVLRILTTLSFRCMYCGTPFRLFKKSSRRSG